jgi:hypothetical protein
LIDEVSDSRVLPEKKRKSTMCRTFMILVGILFTLSLSLTAHAEIYLMDDFESYKVGESLDAGDIWIVHQNANAPGEASDAVSYPPGGKSGYFPGQSAIRHNFAGENLPDTFVLSAFYYHDPTADPAPHYALVLRGPASNENSYSGTVETVANYSIRDKMGTGAETDTGVARKDWVNFIWRVTADETTILIDGEEVYTSTTGGTVWSSETSFIWFGNVWVEEGEGYLDSIIIADTEEEATSLTLAVDARGKLSTTWAELKIR